MGEVLVPLPSPLTATTHVRSTLLCASIQSLRNRSLYDQYLELLAAPDRDEIHALTAGIWLPVERALTHYAACDALTLARTERIEIGTDVSQRIQQSLVSVIVRVSRESGMTPWSVLTRADKLRQQSWQGGGLKIEKLGPKDARLLWAAQPCSRSTHFRLGFQGIMKTLIELYCRRAFVTEDTPTDDDNLSLRVAWA